MLHNLQDLLDDNCIVINLEHFLFLPKRRHYLAPSPNFRVSSSVLKSLLAFAPGSVPFVIDLVAAEF